jgi:hypothetical protein
MITSEIKNFYLFTKDSYGTKTVSIPLLWCSMKTYYEENSSKKDEWQWHDPFITSLSEEEIFSKFKDNPPHVAGFSVFVWNEIYMDDLAAKIKQKYPNCLIIYGGPQQNVKHNKNYFQDKPWVDMVFPSDAYGEIVIKEVLDHYPIDNYELVPYGYYTDQAKQKHFSVTGIDKRAFHWPNNIFKAQAKHILPYLTQARIQNFDIVALYDTARGCPYKCIYCEWGGGTHTKVVKKPYTTVLDELEWLSAEAKITRIEITDANFGIMGVDLEIAQHLADLKNKYKYPKNVDITNAKNNIDRVLDIMEIFLDADMISQYIIPIQTLDPITKENIQRTDIPFEQQIEGLARLRKNKNGAKMITFFESIMGLPGDSYQVNCSQIDTLYEHHQPLGSMLNHTWMLLPETPAFTPEMREQFKIKTVKKTLDFFTKIKPGIVVSGPIPDNTMAAWTNSSVEIVVSTYSYTTEEWISMLRLNNLVIAGERLGINDYLLKYLVQEHNLRPSQVLTDILDYAYIQGFKNSDVNEFFKIEQHHIIEWLYQDNLDSGIDIGENFPFLIPYYAFLLLITSSNSAVINELAEMFAEKYQDEKVKDLGQYISNSLMGINYFGPREFITSYDWLNYFDNDSILAEEGSYSYQTVDSAHNCRTLQEYYCWMLDKHNENKTLMAQIK